MAEQCWGADRRFPVQFGESERGRHGSAGRVSAAGDVQ